MTPVEEDCRKPLRARVVAFLLSLAQQIEQHLQAH